MICSEPAAPAKADEAYRNDGVLTSIATCLKVAGEPAAEDLHQRVLNAADPKARDGDASVVLDKIGDHRSHRPQDVDAAEAEHAFSVLLMCAHIVHAWDQYGSADSWSDPAAENTGDSHAGGLDRTHQALVISPAKQERRLRLPPGPLVRLLGTPKLLPPAYVSGLVVKDAVVDAPLLLNHAVISVPVTFTNVVFIGGNYLKENFGEPQTKERAVSIVGAHFRDQLSFAKSTFRGNVRIKDSRFDERLLIKYTNQSYIGKPRDCQSDGGRTVSIINSRFGLGISITDSRIPRVIIADSRVTLLTLASNRFDRAELYNNSLDTTYWSSNIIFCSVRVIANRHDGDLWIDDGLTPLLRPKNQQPRTESHQSR